MLVALKKDTSQKLDMDAYHKRIGVSYQRTEKEEARVLLDMGLAHPKTRNKNFPLYKESAYQALRWLHYSALFSAFRLDNKTELYSGFCSTVYNEDHRDSCTLWSSALLF